MATSDSLALTAEAAYQDALTLANTSLSKMDNSLTQARSDAITGVWTNLSLWLGQNDTVSVSLPTAPDVAPVSGLNLQDVTLAATTLRTTDAVFGASDPSYSSVSTGLAVDPTLDALTINSVGVNAPTAPTISDYTTSVTDAYDLAFANFSSDIIPQVQEYITTFFPDIAEAVKTDSDAWITGTLENGNAMPVAVVNALWETARDREVAEATRVEQSIVDAGAARGFFSPSGNTAYAVLTNTQSTTRKLASISRDIAVKSFDVVNENSKVAVGHAVTLRTSFLSSLGNFIGIAMKGTDTSANYAKLVADSKASLYDNLVRLYASDIDKERMRTNVGLENNSRTIQRGSALNDTATKIMTARMEEERGRVTSLLEDNSRKLRDAVARADAVAKLYAAEVEGNRAAAAVQLENAATMLKEAVSTVDSSIQVHAARLKAEELRVGTIFKTREIDTKYAGLNVDYAHNYNMDTVSRAKVLADVSMSAAQTLAEVAGKSLATRNTMIGVSAGISE